MICIYMAINKVNGKKYIGKTINFKARYKKHKYAKYYNTYFHNAIRKYGFGSFEWVILEKDLPKKRLIERENYWIDFYNTLNNGYNLRKDSQESSGWKHSKETKEKISKSGKGRTAWNKGINYQKQLTVKGRNSFIEKMSGANNPMSKTVFQYDLNYIFISCYDSVSTAASTTGFNHRGISRCALKQRKSYKGFVWSCHPIASHHSDMMVKSPLIAGKSPDETISSQGS